MRSTVLTGRVGLLAAAAIVLATAQNPATAAISWDNGGASSWWFDPANWSGTNLLPPGGGTTATDTNINQAVTVNYDVANDPFYATANTLTYPNGFGVIPGGARIWRLYLSSGVTTTATLNIKSGILAEGEGTNGESTGGYAIIGRNGVGIVNVTGGTWIEESNSLDVGGFQNTTGDHSGTVNYFGGNIEVGLLNTTDSGTGALRLAPSTIAGAANSSDGTLRVYNTGPNGHIRLKNFSMSGGVGNNGADTLLEFHYGVNPYDANTAGVRPIQVGRSFTVNNNVSNLQKSVLSLILDANPEGSVVGSVFVPENLALVDNAFNLGFAVSVSTNGTFVDPLNASLPEGSIIARVAPDGYTYRWTLSYTGLVGYSDANNSLVNSVTNPGNGRDVVLIGLDSTKPVPEPAALGGLALAALVLGRRRA
jgi:hypothetical protein